MEDYEVGPEIRAARRELAEVARRVASAALWAHTSGHVLLYNELHATLNRMALSMRRLQHAADLVSVEEGKKVVH